MWDNLPMIYFMAKVCINGPKETFMLEIGFKEKCKVLVNFTGNRGMLITANIKMIWSMEKVKWNGIHIRGIEEIGPLAKNMDMVNK